MAQSLYEKYGGFGQVNHVVMAFYDELLDSENIGPFFDDVDMKQLIDHQTKFVAFLLGGPAEFSPNHLQRAHADMDISDAHFDELKTILSNTLAKAGFSPEDVIIVMEKIESFRIQVVG